MNNNFWIVDIFGRNKFEGTPATVFLVDDYPEEDFMQNLATELNTPETVFVKEMQNGDFETVCFSPISKGLDFGYSIVAAAYVIKFEINGKSETINIIHGTRVFVTEFLDDGKIKVRFSSAKLNKVKVPDELGNAIGGELIVSVTEAKDDIIVELRGPTKLVNLNPNLDILKGISCKSIIFTADTHYDTDLNYDFCAKVYAPKFGLLRSIVTPFAYVKLASYWTDRTEKRDLVGYQISNNQGTYSNITYEENFTYVCADCFLTTKGEIL